MAKAKVVMSGAFTVYGHKFICPACDHPVVLPTSREATGHAWGFNGDLEAPVFSPSVLQKWSCWSPERRALAEEFNAEHKRWPTREEMPDDVHHVCHSFVGCNGAAPGQIIFLGDCTHKMAGMVVDLPDVESDWGNRDD